MTVIDYNLSLEEQCEAIWAATLEQERAERQERLKPPVIKLWDGEGRLQYMVTCEFGAEADHIDNDTGTAQIDLPAEVPVAQWIHDTEGRLGRGEKRNILLTIDYCGGRWSGLLDDHDVEETEDGDQILTAHFLSDYEQLKSYQIWSNPFFPAAVQIPRVWMLPGPSTWALKTSLFLQILRDQAALWSIPDDPLKLSNWFNLNQSTWSVVVKPESFLDAMASGVLWAMPISRWKTFHDVAQPVLEDAELSVRCDRWFTGDPLPWPGANLRNGVLVVDIIDNSGTTVGTSHGGTIFDGLVRTVEQYVGDMIDATVSLAADTPLPSEYLVPGQRSTNKLWPYAIIRPGVTPGVVSAKYTETPSKHVQVNCGGHSMPGVNELISASIQALGDIVGNMLQIGSIGGSVDTLLKPFYEDTILAWMSVKSILRAQNSGWIRYFEWFQEGADKAYTLSSLMVLRAGFWATRTWYAHQVEIIDMCPILIGDRGKGHVWVGDRMGSTIPADTTGRVRVDRVSKVSWKWDETQFMPDVRLVIGDDKKAKDPLVRVVERIEGMVGGMHDLGVF